MKKILIIGISGLPVLIGFILNLWIYAYFSSTSSLILVLLLSFTSILISITLYLQLIKQFNNQKIPVLKWSLLTIEDSLLPIFPIEFFENSNSLNGKLYCANQLLFDEEITYETGNYNQLIDTAVLSFSNQITIELVDLNLIYVGDNQFCISAFNRLVVKQKSSTIASIERKNNRIKGQIYEIELDYLVNNNPIIIFSFPD